MVTVYIGLGSNLNNPILQITLAVSAISQLSDVTLLDVSGLYSSEPMGPKDQPDYINAVAKIATPLSPESLLNELQNVEEERGRVRSAEKWGARTLDLDILLFGDEMISSDRLIIPHYGLYERPFVLYPLEEIASDQLNIPGRGTLAQLLLSCEQGSLKVIPESREKLSEAVTKQIQQ